MATEAATTHTKRATLELRQKILSGDLPGGTRLYEVALADMLDISRTPVREAMSRLAEEGLLDRAPGGGYMVRSFSRRDVSDAIEIRGTLEGLAARLAAERGGGNLSKINRLLAGLDACFGAASLTVNFEAYSELNGHFHAELIHLAASPMLERELERVKSLPFASPSAFVPSRDDRAGFERSLVIAQAQHHALVQAIEAREGARAEAIAREHARLARANFDAAISPSGKIHLVPGQGLIAS